MLVTTYVSDARVFLQGLLKAPPKGFVDRMGNVLNVPKKLAIKRYERTDDRKREIIIFVNSRKRKNMILKSKDTAMLAIGKYWMVTSDDDTFTLVAVDDFVEVDGYVRSTF